MAAKLRATATAFSSSPSAWSMRVPLLLWANSSMPSSSTRRKKPFLFVDNVESAFSVIVARLAGGAYTSP